MNRSIAAACAFLLFAAASVSADVVTKRDGTILKGTVIQEDADIVTLQSNVGELVTRSKIARKDITDIKRDVKPEATFCRIPIEGEIGTAVKAQWLAKALEQARALNSGYVVLYIDSGGGHVDEMVKIIELIKENKDLKFIAHVKNAGSAAAIIAMTCPTIILTPDGSIGAAVPFKFGPDGTPENIEAKFFSYFESIARSAAATGGHNTLLIRGMMESKLVLSRVMDAGVISIVEGDKGTVIKKAGTILTLQGREALSAGLAAGISEKLVDTPSLVGLKSWASAGDSAWAYMKARQNEQSNVRDQIAALQKQRADAAAQAAKIQDTVTRLGEQFKQDAKIINDQYTRTISANRLPSEMEAAVKKARETRDAEIAALTARYDAAVAEQKRLFDAAAATVNAINAQLPKLQSQVEPH